MCIWVLFLLMVPGGCAAHEGGVVRADEHPLACANRMQRERYWQRTKQRIADNSAYPVRQVTDWVILTPSAGGAGGTVLYRAQDAGARWRRDDRAAGDLRRVPAVHSIPRNADRERQFLCRPPQANG